MSCRTLRQHCDADSALRRVRAGAVQALKVLQAQPALVDVPIPDEAAFTVCGDVHGQFYDLLNIFELNGVPSEDNPYLFNGERGSCRCRIPRASNPCHVLALVALREPPAHKPNNCRTARCSCSGRQH